MADHEVVVPELGDGITSGTVISITEGAVEEGDTLIEIETDKAVLPVPAPFSGKIKKIFVKEGEEIAVGGKIAIISAEQSSGKTPPPHLEAEEKVEEKSSGQENNLLEANTTKKNDTSKTTIKKSFQPLPQSYGKEIAAGPGSRKIARELGVDLTQVNGSGRGGRITVEDVKVFIKETMSGGGIGLGGNQTIANKPLPDFSKFGEVSIENASNLRKTIADHMNHCWSTIPHVHQFQDIDVSEIVSYQKTYGAEFKEQGSAVSVTLFIIKAMAQCLKEFPIFNTSYDYQNNQIHHKKYFNIGIAVDTPSGLIVPVLKDVDEKNIFTIGKSLKEIAVKTRERKVLPKDLQGACITLSNLGGIGGKHFTPVVNSPEVAIIGAGRTSIQPVYLNGEFIPRSILPICLAYDHRVIDGAEGARFIMRLTELLENPQTLLMGLEK